MTPEKHTDSDYKHACYLNKIIRRERFDEALPKAMKMLSKLEFDTIAFRGLSGALLAGPLAHLMGKEMIACRKHGEVNHSGNACEGFTSARKYVIVDDLVSSGSTVRAIMRMISVFAPHAQCVGIFVWDDYEAGPKCMGFRPVEFHYLNEDMRYNEWGEVIGTKIAPEENNNAESYVEENPQVCQKVVSQDSSPRTGVCFVGLQRSAEQPAEVKARVKREKVQSMRGFTDKLYEARAPDLRQGNGVQRMESMKRSKECQAQVQLSRHKLHCLTQ